MKVTTYNMFLMDLKIVSDWDLFQKLLHAIRYMSKEEYSIIKGAEPW